MDPRLHTLLTGSGGTCSAAQLRALGVDDHAVATLVRSGELVRLRRGLFAEGEVWRGANPEQRLVARTRAVLLDRPAAAASHASAAAVHGLPLWDVPLTVDVVCTTPRRRVRGGVCLRPWPKGAEAMDVDGIATLPPAIAIAQVALEHGHVPGLVCLDRALNTGLVTPEGLADATDVLTPGARARQRLAHLLREADPACESVGETRTRVLLRDLGFEVQSQVRISDARGLIGRVDFLVGERVVVEFDGMVKYGGADGRRALQAEKAREDRLRDAGYVVVRLVWADLDDPKRVRDLVQRAIRRAR